MSEIVLDTRVAVMFKEALHHVICQHDLPITVNEDAMGHNYY